VWRSQPESFGFRHLPRDLGPGEKANTGGALTQTRARPLISWPAVRILWTDVRLIESCRAISDGPTPAARSCFTLSAFTLAVGALPLYFPSALAYAREGDVLVVTKLPGGPST
jgi:hypothetical protein